MDLVTTRLAGWGENVHADCVLAEHGGAMEFSAEDFRRRVKWGEECARAADLICPTGNHRHDWDPHRVHVEPLLQQAKPGETIKAMLVLSNPMGRVAKVTAMLNGRGVTGDESWELEAAAGRTAKVEMRIRLTGDIATGRYVFVVHASNSSGPDSSDAFLVVDIIP